MSFSLIVIPLVPLISTWSVELPIVTTPFTIDMVSALFSLIVIPDVPFIVTLSVELPMVTTPLAILIVSALFSLRVKPLELMVTLSVVGPIVVVAANCATWEPPCVIVKPLESTTALLFESWNILTVPFAILIQSSVDVVVTAAPALPITDVAPNIALTWLFSVMVTPSLSTTTLSFELSWIDTPPPGDNTITSSVAPWAPPIVHVVPLSSAIDVLPSLNIILVESILTWFEPEVPTTTLSVK